MYHTFEPHEDVILTLVIQGDSGGGKTWVGLSYSCGVPPAGEPLLFLPAARAGWGNLPNLSKPNQGI